MRTLFGWGIKLPVPKGLWQCVMPDGYFIRDKALNCDLFELGVKPLRLMAGGPGGPASQIALFIARNGWWRQPLH